MKFQGVCRTCSESEQDFLGAKCLGVACIWLVRAVVEQALRLNEVELDLELTFLVSDCALMRFLAV